MKNNRALWAFVAVFLLGAVFASSSFGFSAIKIKDELPKNSPKGYVSFYFNDENSALTGVFNLYRIENETPVVEEENIECRTFWQNKAREFRIAKTPGDYTFQIKHNNYIGVVSVKIVENAVSYVTIQTQVVKNTTNSGGTTIAYYVNTTVGHSVIPVKPDESSLFDILAALDDDDMATRWAALDAMAVLIGKNKKNDPAPIIAKLSKLYFNERYYEVQEKIKELLKKLGKPLDYDNKNTILWSGFVNNYSNWYLDDKKYYLNANGYNFDQDNDGFNWVYLTNQNLWPANLTIELTMTWKSGITNYDYGFMMGGDYKNFYSFCISRNGSAVVRYFKDSFYVKDLIPWKAMDTINSARNRLKIEIRGDNLTYYVNDVLVGTVTNDAGFTYKNYGLIVGGKQAVCFNLLRITKVNN